MMNAIASSMVVSSKSSPGAGTQARPYFAKLLSTAGVLLLACGIHGAAGQDAWEQVAVAGPPGPGLVSRNQLLAPDKAEKAVDRAKKDFLHGRLEAAQTGVSRALAIYPRFAVAQVIQGELCLAKGDYAGADKSFREAIENDPSLAAAYLGTGIMLIRQNRLQEALTRLDRAETLAPASWLVHFEIALAKLRAGDAEGSLKHAELAERFAGKNSHLSSASLYLRALICMETRDIDAAKEYLARVVGVDPNGEYAGFAKRDLDRLQPLVASAR